MKLLSNKVVLITGGARGIGEAIVRRLAEHDATVVFTYISASSAERANKLVAELEATGAVVKAYQSNAASHQAAEALINDVVKTFGKLDVLVNNAGVTRDNLLLRMTEQEWNEVIDNNLKSVFNLSKFALKPMLRQRGGSIINISSVVGLMGQAGQANYAASKAGMIGFTKSLAKEMGKKGIRCNAIAPGFIETDMTEVLNEDVLKKFLENIPLDRAGKANEVADVVLFLASGMSSYITGQVLSVCGGMCD